jgi:hypothetical protein
MRKALILCCGLVVGGMSTAARADVNGCTLLLCLSSPTSWTSIPECVDPVRSFLSAQKKNKGLSPSCPEQFPGVTSSVAQGARVYTLTSPDGTAQQFSVPVQSPAQ